MVLIDSNRKIKGLFSIFILCLGVGLICLFIANSIDVKYNVARDNLVTQISDKNLSDKEIRKIKNTLQSINTRFHTSEYVAIFEKNDGINDVQYLDLDLKKALFLFPMNAKKKDNIITKGISPTEGFDGEKYYIVHQYTLDWYYLFPVGFIAASGILLILMAICQFRYVYTQNLKQPSTCD